MRKNIKVSVITVCLNSENTIERSIKSVLEQTYKEIEYIIVDGQSTDGTLGIVNKYKSKIAKIVCEPDEGLYYAMNKGISMATGDVVGIINSDDWYEIEAVESVVECFAETNADVVYGNMRIVGSQETLMGVDKLSDLQVSMVIPHPTVFVKREVYKKYGMFNTDYKIAADYDLLLHLYNEKMKFHGMDRILASFSIGGLSSQKYELRNYEEYMVARSYCNAYMSGSEQEELLDRINFAYRGNCFIQLLEHDNSKLADIVRKKMRNAKKEKVAIWGSGNWGRKFGSVLFQNGIPISFYIDKDLSKKNKMVDSVVIEAPGILTDFDGIVFSIVRIASEEIRNEINILNNYRICVVTWEELVDIGLN